MNSSMGYVRKVMPLNVGYGQVFSTNPGTNKRAGKYANKKTIDVINAPLASESQNKSGLRPTIYTHTIIIAIELATNDV